MLTIEYQCFISILYARRFETLITLSINSLLKNSIDFKAFIATCRAKKYESKILVDTNVRLFQM